jgi:integrase
VHGQIVPESSGSTEKADAENLLKQRIGDVAAGRRVGPERATIADLCALVVADNQLRKLRDAQNVAWRYNAHIEPVLGSLPASRFASAQVRQYVAQRRAAGASDGTINRELSIVRRGFKLGAQEDPPLVQRQPAIPRLEEDNARQGFLEQDQYEGLLEELPRNLKAPFVCGYHTGARKNELRRLRWDQVDIETGLIGLFKRAGVQDRVAMEISGHRTRSIFGRYNIVDTADLQDAGGLLEDYARRRKQQRAAPLQRVR